MSTPHLTRTETFSGHAARLTDRYLLHQNELGPGERRRLGWIKLFSEIVDYAKERRWPELLNHEKDIEKIVQNYTVILEGETRDEMKKLKGASNIERKTHLIPSWDRPYDLKRLSPLLYRSYDFYQYVLDDLKSHYGEGPVSLGLGELQKLPSWLKDKEPRSFCNRIFRETWESPGVTNDERLQALVSLRGPTANKDIVDAKMYAVDKAARQYSSNPPQLALSHRVPMGYRQNAIYYGQQLA